MEITEMEETLKLIREREDYLVNLKYDKDILACRHGSYRGPYTIFTLNEEEKEFLKSSCIAEIKRLRKSIECLTE